MDSNSLPKPITPEYIYGCSTEKRDSIFKEIISKFTKDKSELENKLKDSILQLKKLDKEEYNIKKGEKMPKFENEKSKIDKLKKIIEGFENKSKNKWIPPPEVIRPNDACQNEKDSNENNVNKLKINVGKTDYKKDNLVLNIFLSKSEEENLNKEVKLKKVGDFNEEIVWDLEPNEWKNIDKYLFIIEYCVGNMEERNWVKLNISQIKETKELLFDCPIYLYTVKDTIKISIAIKLIIPEGKLDFEEGKNDSITVKKIFPPFGGKSNDTNNIPNFLLE